MLVADAAVSPRDGPMSRLRRSHVDCSSTRSLPRATRSRAARCRRSAVAVVELAVLLPLLMLLFVMTVDFARVFYFSLTLTNCAAQGASMPAIQPPPPNLPLSMFKRPLWRMPRTSARSRRLRP